MNFLIVLSENNNFLQVTRIFNRNVNLEFQISGCHVFHMALGICTVHNCIFEGIRLDYCSGNLNHEFLRKMRNAMELECFWMSQGDSYQLVLILNSCFQTWYVIRSWVRGRQPIGGTDGRVAGGVGLAPTLPATAARLSAHPSLHTLH